MPSCFLITHHGTALVESLSFNRYSQNVSNCDEEKEKEITCHTKPHAVMFYKASAVSQCPSVLLVQSTGLTIDLINWSSDKVQLRSAIICRMLTGFHRLCC